MPAPAPSEDRVHPPGEDPRWRESYYFSFFDPDKQIGGFSSIGKRPARGHSGFVNVVWGPRRPTLIASELDTFERHDDTHAVAGLSYRCDRPFGPWQLGFEGQLNDGGSAIECDRAALGPTGRSTAPKVDVRFELTFTPDRPPYLYEQSEQWRDLFDGHVDEVGSITGELWIDGERHAIDGRGGKDHSWGVRDWFKPDEWRWVDLVGDGAVEAALWRARVGDDDWFGDGALFSASGAESLTSYSERITTTAREGGKALPSTVEVEAGSATQSAQVRGEVVRVVPILFTRAADGGGSTTSWNDRALVRCETETGEAWANVEFESLLTEPGEP